MVAPNEQRARAPGVWSGASQVSENRRELSEKPNVAGCPRQRHEGVRGASPRARMGFDAPTLETAGRAELLAPGARSLRRAAPSDSQNTMRKTPWAHLFIPSFLFVVAWSSGAHAAGPAYSQQGSFAGPCDSFFGYSVAIDANTALVGAWNDNAMAGD